MISTYAYGFPRLGKNREYKKTIESFWQNKITEIETKKNLAQLQADMVSEYRNFVDNFPVGEMTAYDPMLDCAIICGLYDPRDLKEYYELCRGKNALEMTKWFNTNYHYLVTDFSAIRNPNFKLSWNKPKEYFENFRRGIPYIIGPFTFLKLSKGIPKKVFRTIWKESGWFTQKLLKI